MSIDISKVRRLANYDSDLRCHGCGAQTQTVNERGSPICYRCEEAIDRPTQTLALALTPAALALVEMAPLLDSFVDEAEAVGLNSIEAAAVAVVWRRIRGGDDAR